MEGVSVVCVPGSDKPFTTMVERVLSALPPHATGAHLQRELRTVYPNAVVRPEAGLAPVGGARSLRYAYRDPEAASDERDAWADPDVAEGGFDALGIYREANTALMKLFGVASADDIVGHEWSEFVSREAVDAARLLWADLGAAGLLVTTTGIASTFHVRRPDGSVVEIEYRTAWDPTAEVFRTRMRPVRVARVEPAAPTA